MGATYDKTIVRFDEAATGLRDGDYGRYSCDIYDKNGVFGSTQSTRDVFGV